MGKSRPEEANVSRGSQSTALGDGLRLVIKALIKLVLKSNSHPHPVVDNPHGITQALNYENDGKQTNHSKFSTKVVDNHTRLCCR